MSLKLKIVYIITALVFTLIIVFMQIIFYDSKDTPQFLRDMNYTIRCDERFLQHPINCRIEDQFGNKITEKTINSMSYACWVRPHNSHDYLPCMIETGSPP